ncbi:MAG: gliding motility-associated C-terminal domain-containing protein [Bacteroidales bacterium]|nr:gliding motility-associated C-terminal domain-containing protein [Bacteroidales bacterium]
MVVLAFLLIPAVEVSAQDYIYRLNATTHGQTLSLSGGSLVLRDDDSFGPGAPLAGSPQVGQDFYTVISGGCGSDARIMFVVEELSVHCLDTVYIYEGGDTNGNLIMKFNSSTGNVHEGDVIFEPPTNHTGLLTIRFRTDPQFDPARTHLPCFENRDTVGAGFAFSFNCTRPCETVIPVIDTMFYRTRNGEIYDSSYIREITILKNIYENPDDTTSAVVQVDTTRFMGAHLCIGDGVIFRGHGEYSNKYGYYTPTDSTSIFTWNFANQEDSLSDYNLTEVAYNDYQRQGCFDMALYIEDEYGCKSTVYSFVKVRTSMNPIKTIYTLKDICNSDSLMVRMGYDAASGNLILRKVESDSSVSKTYEVRTFIPDGCNCATPSYFEAPVEFKEFPAGRRVTSAKDICSICINMEHSFMGDIYITIVCPTGNEAVLKWGNPSSCTPAGLPSSAPTTDASGAHLYGGEHGSGTFLGFPIDGFNGWYDNTSNKCDSLTNPFGIGYDYCFSRDTNYTLITGQNAKAVWTANNTNPQGQFYLGSGGYTVSVTETVPPMPAHFARGGQTPGTGTQNTKHPSDHENKLDYYMPWASFSELVGCPLNGLWKIRVYDTWGSDNGWIFNWSLDICNVSVDGDCKYEVGIDSLVWAPKNDPQYYDYDLGRFRGLQVNQTSPVISYISTPDTAGTFPIDVTVYDEFGCVWDTVTSITTYWTPEPKLIASDTTLCGSEKILLDASDRHSTTQNYSYAWYPYGQDTDTISTKENFVGDERYIVEVKNTQSRTTCSARDTIDVHLRKQPFPSIYPSPFDLEGCAPMTLHFDNQSVDALTHFWDFGDGITSTEASPTHTYGVGTYTLKYYAGSDQACRDSIIANRAITVYPSPKAAFMWEPAYPSALSPQVQFTNLSTPKNPDIKYTWEMQYNQENPLSVETLEEENPLFDYTRYTTGNPAGNYRVSLITSTETFAPSGHVVVCSDTVSNNILVINDFLQFPNVVTPNGDGINDRFVIGNLVDGIAYPINQLDIYNKWGTRVYHKENISRMEDFWDPSDMPAGTYFYRFSAKGYSGDVEHNGAVEVIK